MKYRRLGASNLDVSVLCLGALTFGESTDAAASADIVAAAREQGVNFIDTADVYNLGVSETLVGQLIASDRDRWVLASKVGNRMSGRRNEGRYSRKWVMQALEASLRRLATDYLDIYYLHRDFEDENLEEPLRALDDLIRAGKIRYYGLSNFRAWRMAEVIRLADRIGMPRPVVCQPHYNLLNRTPEVELLPACRHYGLGVVPYSPVARGVLTGKYTSDQPPGAETRAGRGDKRILETEFRPESLAIARRLVEVAAARGVPASRFATAWVLANRNVNSVIAGPRTLAQWQDYAGAEDFAWSEADEQAVDALVAPGATSSPGFQDPAYPFDGRRGPRD